MAKIAIQSIISAIITLIIIWLLKKTNIPFISDIAREV